MNKIIRIANISDTHTYHRQLDMPEVDLVLCSGDISFKGEKHVIEDFNQWAGELKRLGKTKEFVTIVGNHELAFDPSHYTYDVARKELFTNCHYLEDSSIELFGLNIYGSPATPWFHNWAFNKYRGDEIRETWDKMTESHKQKSIDIVMTHGPASHILDWVETRVWSWESDQPVRDYVGCSDLLKALKEIRPTMHLCGHIHQAYGTKKKHDILFVNASNCTEEYEATNPVIIVELEKVDDKWKSKVVKR